MGVKVKDIYYRSTLKAGAGIVGSDLLPVD